MKDEFNNVVYNKIWAKICTKKTTKILLNCYIANKNCVVNSNEPPLGLQCSSCA